MILTMFAIIINYFNSFVPNLLAFQFVSLSRASPLTIWETVILYVED
jgi:hypothetical protein